MARKTKEEAQATRSALLEAAARVFVEKGVAKASLEEIAENAGVTRGAVYWHFKNKADLFQAMHESLHKPFLGRILEDLEKDHPNPLEQLKELCITLFEELTADEYTRNLLTVFFLRCDYAGDMQETLTCQCQKKQEKQELFQRYFERAQAKGHLPQDVDPYILTTSFSCYTSGILIEYLRNPTGFDLKNLSRPLLEPFFKAF